MIRISPKIEFDAECPKDGTSLNVEGVVIPGMRCLADTVCPACGARYYVDLPAGHALWSPVTLNRETGEVTVEGYEPSGAYWFSDLLRDSFAYPVEAEVVPKVHKFFDADRVVIVNCLDFLYGHSLLKLLNVQRHLDHHPQLGCCVLVPTQLTHLVPDGVAEIWEFPVKIKEGCRWYPSLQRWMNRQLAQRRECFLSPAYSHLSNRVYDLRRFVRDVPDVSTQIRPHQPIVLFSYREDRLWGRTFSQQQRNLQKLYEMLGAIFPGMAFVLVGFGRRNKIRETGAKLIDLRTDEFDVERDRLWMAYMGEADCVVGVHGSNMLLPSGLAGATVELVPRSRLGNTVQDFLFAPGFQDARDSLLFYRMLYGNEALSDIRPVNVTDMVACLLYNARHNGEWFKAEEDRNIRKNLESIHQQPASRQARSYIESRSKESLFRRGIRRLARVLPTKWR